MNSHVSPHLWIQQVGRWLDVGLIAGLMLCSTESAAVRKPACADLTKTDSTIGKTDRKEGKRKLNDQMTRHCTCRDTVSCHLQGLFVQCLQPNPEIKSHSCCNPTKIHEKSSPPAKHQRQATKIPSLHDTLQNEIPSICQGIRRRLCS